ncbi:hypothetical protein BpHYR1_033493 [Brachionus plicatilis]|uniref:Uncharacterized protein n=1 Tax=Brachionus plicatilis TaxID=10195 RepID=A0A3M7QWV2_BRAPC|nr:hypothetical protein BpHYR1_033493 [Brachionus plicatilis]
MEKKSMFPKVKHLKGDKLIKHKKLNHLLYLFSQKNISAIKIPLFYDYFEIIIRFKNIENHRKIDKKKLNLCFSIELVFRGIILSRIAHFAH